MRKYSNPEELIGRTVEHIDGSEIRFTDGTVVELCLDYRDCYYEGDSPDIGYDIQRKKQ